MWRARTSCFGALLLDRLVVDLPHRGVGDGGLALLNQQHLHRQLVADEGDAALEFALVGDLLGLGGLRGQDHVGDVGHQRVALGRALELLHLLAHVLFGHREVAFPDLDARDLGDHLVALRLGLGLSMNLGRRHDPG